MSIWKSLGSTVKGILWNITPYIKNTDKRDTQNVRKLSEGLLTILSKEREGKNKDKNEERMTYVVW